MCVLHLLGFTALVCVTSASSYADLLADLQYLYNVEQVKNSPMPEYYSENPYADKMDDWGMMYPDVIDEPAPKKARDYGEAVLRDQEYMKQLPLSGYHFISGGTGRDEEPNEVKTDKVLPAYCNPPNPCPVGYTDDDSCLTDFENTPENNQHLQEHQNCACDTEHMLSCPEGQKTIDPKSAEFGDENNNDNMDNLGSLVDMDLSNNPYLKNGKRQRLVAKKSPPFIRNRNSDKERLQDWFDEMNFANEPKRVAAKKAVP